MKLEIGQIYEVLDIFGMMSYKRRYIGTGYKYDGLGGGKDYFRKVDGKYYVFERLDDQKTSYKYAVCLPVFNDNLEFSYFQVKRYGNSLSHIFVNFRQDYFVLGDALSISVENFNLEYFQDKANSG
ncbi:MAG: hypothetical protein AABY22_20935 [Nanoarchaeota archaeon]